MEFNFIDDYLLEKRPAKADLITQILEKRSTSSAAAPFYRALEALGTRVADEAIIALRLVLAGKAPTDAGVKRVRDAAALFHAGDDRTRPVLRADYERELKVAQPSPCSGTKGTV